MIMTVLLNDWMISIMLMISHKNRQYHWSLILMIVIIVAVTTNVKQWSKSNHDFDDELGTIYFLFCFIERGVVWEETIILLPDNVHFVFLSATIPNARQFSEWVAHLHKQVSNLIVNLLIITLHCWWEKCEFRMVYFSIVNFKSHSYFRSTLLFNEKLRLFFAKYFGLSFKIGSVENTELLKMIYMSILWIENAQAKIWNREWINQELSEWRIGWNIYFIFNFSLMDLFYFVPALSCCLHWFSTNSTAALSIPLRRRWIIFGARWKSIKYIFDIYNYIVI